MLLTLLAACSLDPLGGVRPSVDGQVLAGDALNLVAGSQVSLCLEPAHRWSREVSGSRLQSAAPAVADTEAGPCPAVISAGTHPGETRLDLVEEGSVRWSLPIHVKQPDSIDLTPLGPKLLRHELPAAEARPSVLAGGGALFLARPLAEGRPLHGGGWVAGAEGAGAHTVGWTASANTLFYDAVALWVDADTPPGPRSVPVLANGQRMDLGFVVRVPEDVATFEVQGPVFRSVLFIPYGFLLAQGRTASGETVHGLPVQWRFGDEWKPRTGVAFRYTRHDEYPGTVHARWGDFDAAVEVAGTGGTVVDPPNQACSSATGGAAAPLTLLGGLLAGHRRRRTQRPAPALLAPPARWRRLLTVLVSLLVSTAAAASDDDATPGAVRTILRAPGNLERFEPSGAVLRDDQLCVGSDKPLKWGKERASVWACYPLDKLDGRRAKPVGGGIVPGAGKLEAAALLGDGRVAWWDARDQRVWTCAGPTCQSGDQPDLGSAAALASPATVCKVKVEGLAAAGPALWLGLRGFELEDDGDCDDRRFSPHGAILDDRGHLLWDGGALALDPAAPDHRFGISGLARASDGSRLWTTWSYEGTGHDTASVDGRLGWLPLTEGKLAASATLHVCLGPDGDPLSLRGKPEAVVLGPDVFVVVYDNDGERKGRDEGGDRWPLRQDEDYVDRLPASACARDRQFEHR